jgi:hypothetical protein
VKRAVLAGAAAVCLSPAAAQAAPKLALFPTPLTPLTSTPPFQPPPTALPNFYRPPIRSTERIAVAIDEEGDVVSVKATQRLVISRVGDYRLTVPAPVTEVVAAPGSKSSPGLRDGAVLWAGFSPGHRVLAATATLDPEDAAKVLPLTVDISGGAVQLRNETTTTATTYTTTGDPAELAKLLAALRQRPDGRTLGHGAYVRVSGVTRNLEVRVTAPLRVTGRVGGRAVSFVLGAEPRTIRVAGQPEVALSVEPVPPAALYSARERPTWDETLRISLTLARVRQYDGFLGNPDPIGPLTTRYTYRTLAAPAPSPVPEPSTPQDEGLAAWLIALAIAGSVAAAGGLAVLWARS